MAQPKSRVSIGVPSTSRTALWMPPPLSSAENEMFWAPERAAPEVSEPAGGLRNDGALSSRSTIAAR